MKKSIGAKTLAMPAPLWLVGSYDEDGAPNIMASAWCGICSSQPASVTVSLRKATYSYAGIVARKAFTVSIPGESQAVEADYVGIVSGRDVNKFETSGMTAVRSELVDAPYLGEAPVVIECRLMHVLEVGLHTMLVGEIVDVKADESVLGPKGYPDITKVRPICWDPAHGGYYGVGQYLGQAWQIGKQMKQGN
ncbi:MAG TPA: flavin reductase family protein [Deltaproteobacteria bacterium]|nr:flavin reductase family protein [Deltaproteobacteria bacterium]